MTERRRNLAVFAGLLLVTLVLTFPIAVQLGTAVNDFGDPLLNSWILAWETHSLSSLGQVPFFDPNIFFPNRNTLAYSEMLLPQLVVAAPFIATSGNPVLGHNVALLCSLLATAFGTYLLAYYITQNVAASFTAGLILAFCPFMLSHLSHLQIFFAVGIPVTFLFLHRFFELGQTRFLLLAALSYSVQVLANSYYGIYLTLFAGIAFVAQIAQRRRWVNRRLWLQVGLAAIVVLSLLLPVYRHYFQLRSEIELGRGLPAQVGAEALLATPASNRLLGDLTAQFGAPEAYLFPGVTATLLAMVALVTQLRRGVGLTASDWRYRLVSWLLLIFSLISLLILLGLEIDTSFGPLSLRVTSLRNPLSLALVFALVRLWMTRDSRHERPIEPHLRHLGLYAAVLVLTLIVVLDRDSYLLLYRWVPGFEALRAVSRIHIMLMFAISILAAQGLSVLLARSKGRMRTVVAIGVPLLILLEFMSAPLPVQKARKSAEFPEVHHWLAAQSDDPVIVIYPLWPRYEGQRLLYSTLHWRRMVNGISGVTPKSYEELRSMGGLRPSAKSIKRLRSLGADYLIMDSYFTGPRRLRVWKRFVRKQGLKEIGVFDGVPVYRIP